MSAVLQLALGSRVVTAVVAGRDPGGLSAGWSNFSASSCAGAFMFSSISDPYFWLIKNSTGSSVGEMA